MLFYVVKGAEVGRADTMTDTTAPVLSDLGGDIGFVRRARVISVDANYGPYLRDSTVTAASIQSHTA